MFDHRSPHSGGKHVGRVDPSNGTASTGGSAESRVTAPRPRASLEGSSGLGLRSAHLTGTPSQEAQAPITRSASASPTYNPRRVKRPGVALSAPYRTSLAGLPKPLCACIATSGKQRLRDWGRPGTGPLPARRKSPSPGGFQPRAQAPQLPPGTKVMGLGRSTEPALPPWITVEAGTKSEPPARRAARNCCSPGHED